MKTITTFPIQSISGSAGGKDKTVIFSEHSGTPYVKRYRKTSNPNTAMQSICRKAYSNASRAFSNITDEERSLWRTYKNYLKSKWGVQKKTTFDKDAWMSVNVIRSLLGLLPSNIPPQNFISLPSVESVPIIYHSQNKSLSFFLKYVNPIEQSGFFICKNSCVYLGPGRKYRPNDIRWPSFPCHLSCVPFDNVNRSYYFLNSAQNYDIQGWAFITLDFYSIDFDFAGSCTWKNEVVYVDDIFSDQSDFVISFNFTDETIIISFQSKRIAEISKNGVSNIAGQCYEYIDPGSFNPYSIICSYNNELLIFSLRKQGHIEFLPSLVFDSKGNLYICGDIEEFNIQFFPFQNRHITWDIEEPLIIFQGKDITDSCNISFQDDLSYSRFFISYINEFSNLEE